MAVLMLLTGLPCSLSFSRVLAAQLLDPISRKWISATQEPFLGICPALPRSPISPLLGEANSSSPEGGDPEGPSSYRVTSLGLFQLRGPHPLPPPPPRSRTQPVLFTWYCADGRAGCRPPATARVRASEPINRAILRTTLVKIIALYCSNRYAPYMLNVYEYNFLFLLFENVRSIFFFLIYVERKMD